MAANNLAIIEEEVPTTTALFSLQVSNGLFSILTILIVVFVFGNRLLQDTIDNKMPLQFTLPVSKRLIVAKDDIRIGFVVLVSLLLFLLTFIPTIINHNFDSFNYPYVVYHNEVVKIFPICK